MTFVDLCGIIVLTCLAAIALLLYGVILVESITRAIVRGYIDERSIQNRKLYINQAEKNDGE